MLKATVTGILRPHGTQDSFSICRLFFIALFALSLISGSAPASAQDVKQGPPPATPSAGKALVYIYRTGRILGSAAHDHLYVNGVYLAYLKNSEYAGMEVDPGTVVVTGSTEMYYAGGVAMSSYAGIKNASKKENERIRLDVEAGKTYYMKWTSGAMATGVKVTLVDPQVGAKEMSKLHLSKPVENEKKAQPETKDAAPPPAK